MKYTFIREALSHLIASRAVIDRIQLPNHHFDRYRGGIDELNGWVSIFKNFDPQKPQTWVSTGLKLAQRVSVPEREVKPSKKHLIARFVTKMGLVKIDQMNAIPFYQDIAHKYKKDSIILSEGEEGLLRVLPLQGFEEGFYFFELFEPETHKGKDVDILPFVPDFVSHQDRRHRLNVALADLFWRDKNQIHMTMFSETMDYYPIPTPTREYEGELTSLYNSLSSYREGGVRRVLLFNGPPGTGKSTLALNLAEKLSQRTLILSHETIEWVSQDDWKYLLSMTQPDLLIIDDIDRLGNQLQQKLFLFEETTCKVPYVILTTNHLEWLPDAFKRPGRIDQLIEMETPTSEIRREIVVKLGELEGVQIPDDRVEVLDKIHSQYPGAYIVELLRRVKIEGWDYQIPSYDNTFRALSEDIRDQWNLGSQVPDVPSVEDLDLDDFEF